MRDIVIRELRSLLLLLDELLNALPPYGPQKLAELLHETAESLWEVLEEVLKSPRYNSPEYVNLLRMVQEIHTHYLKYIAFSPVVSPPFEAFLPMISLAKSLNINNFALALLPSEAYNYGIEAYEDLWETTQEEIKNLCDSFGINIPPKPKGNYPKWFIEVSLPFIERRNALMYPLLLHEFAHLKDYNENIGQHIFKDMLPSLNVQKMSSVLESINSKDMLRKRVEEQLRIAQVELNFPQLPKVPSKVNRFTAQLLASWLEMSKRWIGEYVADFIAVRTAGLAYFFSLYEFARICSNLDNYSPTHPSFRARLSYLVPELKSMGYKICDSEDSISEILHNVIKDVDSRSYEPLDNPFYEIPYDFLNNCIPVIRKKVHECPSIKVFNDEAYKIHVPDWSEKISQGLLPYIGFDTNRMSLEANGIIAILNAGWEIYLTRLDDFCATIGCRDIKERDKALINLNDLLLKGIESVEVVRIWQS
ncbi:MAG: hypothetical protein ABIK42_00540 [candidate division WOR-3 bacterium]